MEGVRRGELEVREKENKYFVVLLYLIPMKESFLIFWGFPSKTGLGEPFIFLPS